MKTKGLIKQVAGASLVLAACGEYSLGELTSDGTGGADGSASDPSADGGMVDEGSGGGADGGAGGCSEDVATLPLNWGAAFEGPSHQAFDIRAVVADPSGALAIAGSFRDLHVDLGAGVTLDGVDDGRAAAFVALLDATGQPQWGRVIDGPAHDEALAVAFTSAGGVAVAGRFCDGADPCAVAVAADGGTNSRQLLGYDDGFVAIYDGEGNLEWVESVAGTFGTSVDSIGVGPDDELLIAGNYTYDVAFGPSGTLHPLTSEAPVSQSMFVARYDDHAISWSRGVDAQSTKGASVQASGVSVADDGAIYVSGYLGPNSWGSGTFSGTFGAGEANATTIVNDSTDGFLLRLEPDGRLGWVRSFGGERIDTAQSVAAGIGGVFVTGWFSQTSTWAAGEAREASLTSHGGSDVYVARYQPDGEFDWVVQLGSERSCGPSDRGQALAALADGGAVVAGRFNGPLLLGDPTQCAASIPGEGWGNAFVVQLSANGWIRGARTLSIGSAVCVGGGHFTDVAAANGAATVVGDFSGTIDLGGLSFDGNQESFAATYALE